MIIEKISLKNWRSYRDPHSFLFDEKFNLVVGRNEAGKSTLFEALTRVMFDRYNSKSDEIRKIQPWNSTLAPEVELIFFDNGHRYKIKKRFLQQPSCELFTERNGQWDRDHEGDRADIELQKILKGNAPSRAAQPEHRGLAQALWYLQKEDSLPKKEWTEGIKNNLADIIEVAVKRPEEDKICKSINNSYDEYFSQTGRLKTSSKLAILQKEIDEINDKLENLHSKVTIVANLRSELEDFSERKKGKQESLQRAEQELSILQPDLIAGDIIEGQKSQKENDVKEVDEQYQKLNSDLNTIDRRNKRILDLKQELKDANDLSVQLEKDAYIQEQSEKTHYEKWKNEFEPNLKIIEEELRLNHAAEKFSQLTNERKTFAEKLLKITKSKEDYQGKKRELVEINAPTKGEWNEFEDYWNDLKVTEAEARASAILIRFDLSVKENDIHSQPEVSQTNNKGEYSLLSPTTFTIHKIGSIHIRGGGSSLEELNNRAQSLRESIQKFYSRYNVSDKQILSDLYQKRIDLEKNVKDLKKAYQDIVAEINGKNLDDEINRLDHEIGEESRTLQSAPDSWKPLSGKDLRNNIIQLGKTKQQLIDDIEKEQGNEKNCRGNRIKFMRDSSIALGNIERIKSEMKSLESENVELLEIYGTRDHLISLKTKNRGVFSSLKDELEKILSDYEKKVEQPRKLKNEGETRISTLKEHLQTIERDIIDRKARIEEYAAQGLYSDTSDLEALLDVKKHRLQRVQLEAESIKLLHDMINTLRKEQSSILAGPVSELVNRWLAFLTEDSYDGLELNEELLPIAIQSKRFEAKLPLDSLSYGTYEQIVVLLRLALGVILSKDERNLIVIDDRLVNADPVRMKRLSVILQEVANNSCQIIIATCNDNPYTGIYGRFIHIPADGKLPL